MAKSNFSDPGKLFEPHTTLRLLRDVECEEFNTQRSFSVRVGIAVGLTNAYVKRCVAKGWIKVRRIPARRYAYYLTPKGFSEKSRLVKDYLSSSLEFYRTARAQYTELFQDCERRGWRRVALFGHGELVEIATLAARQAAVDLVVVIAPGCNTDEFAGLPVIADAAQAPAIDAILIADAQNPQAAFDSLAESFPTARLLTPPLLHVTRDTGRDGP